ncbi:Ig-like domain-containing protein [Sporocytophaga myxococcoides]|uniref:Ig-like domain-containing protein n=1 Tax=Sporocytophaga myxococcoides TaxID=153721 RepID=UPI0004224A29|nr:T9SS type A sorting domain-containing protein [Sporocytophaga myxococcoides]
MAFIRLFIFIFFISTSNISFGQLENHNWYFGTSPIGGIRFDKANNPSIIPTKYASYGREGGSVATNPLTGKLIFYTDGLVAVDAQNNVMPNGSGLISSTITYTAQTGTIAPVPNACTQYYIFTTNADGQAGTLYYSIVDMSLKGNGTSAAPLGDVVSTKKNITLSTGVSEAMISIPGSDNNTYWLLSPIFNSTNIQIFKITSTGIQLFNTFNTGVLMQDQRSIRYCKTKGKIALSSFHGADPLITMDFNNSNGAISNITKVPGTPLEANSSTFYGIFDQVFSSDGSKLYISLYRGYNPSSGGKLFQYDFNNSTAAAQEIYKINTNDIYYASLGLQLGPDNKVYWLYTNQAFGDKRIIGRIEYPDSAGVNCIVNPNWTDLGQPFNGVKFPEFLPYNNHTPLLQNDNYTLNCEVNSLIIDPLLNDSDLDNDNLTASILKVKFGNATSTLNKFNYQLNSRIPGEVFDTINYKVCDVTCFNKCDSAVIAIKIQNTSTVDIGKDTSICEGSTMQLNAGLNYSSYKWQDDSNLPTYIVSQPGKYWVTSTTACGIASDTIIISKKASGCEITKIISVSNEDQTRLNLIPNPFQKSSQLAIVSPYSTYSVIVLNLSGMVVESAENLRIEENIEVGASLGSGMYLLKVVVNGKAYHLKMIKN